MRFTLLFQILICLPFVLSGQETALPAVIDNILIEGNKRTLDRIVLRELDFQKGDTISFKELSDELERNALVLMNTGLFSKAKVNIKNWKEGNHLDLEVEVQEAWYIYPLPLFELADRNFNVWWTEFNRDLSRVNYGLNFTHSNFTGRRDYLKVHAQFGYTRKYEIRYRVPYLNKKQTLGLDIVSNYKEQKEIQINTFNNRQVFRENQQIPIYNRYETELSLTYRPKIKVDHRFTTWYSRHQIDESFIINNAEVPDSLENVNFFQTGENRQRYIGFRYRFRMDSRDIRPYATKGSFFQFEISKEGIGIYDDLNTFRSTISYSKYFPWSKKWSSAHNLRSRNALIRSEQPFFNSRGLGFGSSFVRGYEFYVIDGIDFFMNRNTLSYELFNKEYDMGSSMPIKAFRTVPIKIYLTTFGDVGYANNPSFADNNPFSNKTLVGYGVGFNLVLYYDKVFIFEYSFNGEQESGLFIRTQLGF